MSPNVADNTASEPPDTDGQSPPAVDSIADTPDEDRPLRSLDEDDWKTLLDRIAAKTCTPILGAGIAAPHLPSGADLSAELADAYDYPLTDRENLPRVTQFIATRHDADFARRRVLDVINKRLSLYHTNNPGQVPANYMHLAQLELPVYVTTNYDTFLERAITAHRGEKPRVEICRWNTDLTDLGPYADDEPKADSPMVFHLHGHVSNDESILVTEDDYIEFMVSVANRAEDGVPVIDHWVRRRLARTALLFVGYSLEDWNFRFLMRHLLKQQAILRDEQAFSLSIQLPPSDQRLVDKSKRDKAERFLADYLGTKAIRIHWQNADTFLQELSERTKPAGDRGH